MIGGKLLYSIEHAFSSLIAPIANESLYLRRRRWWRVAGISNVPHYHVRTIEPSRFCRASLGTMTSRSSELLPCTVSDDLRRLSINRDSRTETYVNVSRRFRFKPADFCLRSIRHGLSPYLRWNRLCCGKYVAPRWGGTNDSFIHRTMHRDNLTFLICVSVLIRPVTWSFCYRRRNASE